MHTLGTKYILLVAKGGQSGLTVSGALVILRENGPLLRVDEASRFFTGYDMRVLLDGVYKAGFGVVPFYGLPRALFLCRRKGRGGGHSHVPLK